MITSLFLHWAALRELFKSKAGSSSEFTSGQLQRGVDLSQNQENGIEVEIQNHEDIKKKQVVDLMKDGAEKPSSGRKSFVELNDAADEFFDFPELSDCNQLENEWPDEQCSSLHPLVISSHMLQTSLLTWS